MRVNEIYIVKIKDQVFSYKLEYVQLESGTVDWSCYVHSLLDYVSRVDLSFPSSIEAMNFFQRVAVQRAYELRHILDFKEVLYEKEQI